jgi:hypothetical protein
LRAVTGSEHADHTGLTNVAMNLAAELGKLAGDELRRAVLLETEFWMRVQVLPPGSHFTVKQIDEMGNLHGGRLQEGMHKIEGSTLGKARK